MAELFWQLALLGILLPMAAEDASTHRIPGRYPMLLCLHTVLRCGMDGVGAGLLVLAVGYLIYRLGGHRLMGGGDVRLAAAGAWLLGVEGVLWALLVCGVSALLCRGLPVLLCGREHELALGPYLAAGIWLSAWFWL